MPDIIIGLLYAAALIIMFGYGGWVMKREKEEKGGKHDGRNV